MYQKQFFIFFYLRVNKNNFLGKFTQLLIKKKFFFFKLKSLEKFEHPVIFSILKINQNGMSVTNI